MSEYQKAIVIGRYQIYHKGHEQMTRKALEIAEEVLVIVGSSFPVEKHPQSVQVERAGRDDLIHFARIRPGSTEVPAGA